MFYNQQMQTPVCSTSTGWWVQGWMGGGQGGGCWVGWVVVSAVGWIGGGQYLEGVAIEILVKHSQKSRICMPAYGNAIMRSA